MWKTLTMVIVGLAVVVSGLALSIRYDLEWLRIGSIAAGVIGAALAVMVTKNRRQRRSRSSAPDSVEAMQDVNSRAAAFVDAAVLTALAVAVSTIVPGIPAWAMCFVLLAAFTASYWIRRAVAQRGAGNVDI